MLFFLQKNGTAEPSFASRWLEQPAQEKDHESIVKVHTFLVKNTTVVIITLYLRIKVGCRGDIRRWNRHSKSNLYGPEPQLT